MPKAWFTICVIHFMDAAQKATGCQCLPHERVAAPQSLFTNTLLMSFVWLPRRENYSTHTMMPLAL